MVKIFLLEFLVSLIKKGKEPEILVNERVILDIQDHVPDIQDHVPDIELTYEVPEKEEETLSDKDLELNVEEIAEDEDYDIDDEDLLDLDNDD